MEKRPIIKRLIYREYAPMAGLALAWLLTGLAIGIADAARLAAAVMIVAAARGLSSVNTGGALISRRGYSPDIFSQAASFAVRADLLALLAGIPVLGAFVVLLFELGHREEAIFALLIATGFPARYLLGPSRGGPSFTARRMALSWSPAVLMVVVLAADLPDAYAAAAFGLREWIGFAAGKFAKPFDRDSRTKPPPAPLGWPEIAERTYAQSHIRFGFRVSKSLLGVFLGPFGGILARTGRGAGMHRRLGRFTPRSRGALAATGIGTMGGGILLLALSQEPLLVVAAASLIHIGATAMTTFGWSFFVASSGGRDTIEEEED